MSEQYVEGPFVYGSRREWLTEDEAFQVVKEYEELFQVDFTDSLREKWAKMLQHESQSNLEIQLRAVNQLFRNWENTKPPRYGNLADEIEDAVREWKWAHQPPIEPAPQRTLQELKEMHERVEQYRQELLANRDAGPARP